MKEYKTQDLRNISLIGGAQTGKTTLGEAIIFNSGAVSRQGSVDEGSSLLDFQADEITKKISMSSSLFWSEVNGSKLNFIDTPGYSAFVSNVTTSITVCESALIVMDAESGVDVGVKKAWRKASEANRSKFLFVNKMDKERVNFETIINQSKEMLSPKVFPLFIPIGEAEEFKGILDILSQKAYVESGKKMEIQDIPTELKSRAEELRGALVESAAENSEELLDKYLENGNLSEEDLLAGLKMGIKSNDFIPLLIGSARKNTGIKRLIEVLEILAPDPHDKEDSYTVMEGGEEKKKSANAEGNPFVHVFKIIDDPKIGEYFCFKVCQGTVNSSLELMNINSSQKERIGHIFLFSGKTREEVNTLHAGDIGATAKLKTAKIGHALGDAKSNLSIKPFNFPRPVISEAIMTESEKDNEKMMEVLQSLNRLDPCFTNKHVAEFNERIISGMSKLHIDSMVDRVRSKLNITITLDKPKIPYRETIRKNAKAQGKYKKQTGGHGQYGDCRIELIPKSIGSGYNFVDNISGGVIPAKYIPAVNKGIQDAASKGILAGFPVVDFEVSLYDGSYHSVDSSDLAFQMAGILGFKKAAEGANPILLEPIINVKVTIPDSAVGDVSADFNQRRGKILGIDPTGGGYTVIQALVPQGELHNYSVDLDSITKGDAEFEESLEKYEPVPSHIGDKVIKEFARAKEG